jgi:hypothetical protein
VDPAEDATVRSRAERQDRDRRAARASAVDEEVEGHDQGEERSSRVEPTSPAMWAASPGDADAKRAFWRTRGRCRRPAIAAPEVDRVRPMTRGGAWRASPDRMPRAADLVRDPAARTTDDARGSTTTKTKRADDRDPRPAGPAHLRGRRPAKAYARTAATMNGRGRPAPATGSARRRPGARGTAPDRGTTPHGGGPDDARARRSMPATRRGTRAARRRGTRGMR